MNKDNFDKAFESFDKISVKVMKFAGVYIAFCIAAGITLTVGTIWLIIVLIGHFS